MAWSAPALQGSRVAQATAGHSLSWTSATTYPIGTLMVVSGGMNKSSGADTIVVTDSQGNTWTVYQKTRTSTSRACFLAFCKLTVALSSSDTITVADTVTGGTNFNACAFEVCTLTGFDPTTTEDTSVAATTDAGATTSPTITSGVPTYSGDLVWSIYHNGNGTSGAVFTEDATWTAISSKQGTSSTVMYSTAFIVAGGSAVTRTCTSASVAYEMITVGFKVDPTATGAVKGNLLMMGV